MEMSYVVGMVSLMRFNNAGGGLGHHHAQKKREHVEGNSAWCGAGAVCAEAWSYRRKARGGVLVIRQLYAVTSCARYAYRRAAVARAAIVDEPRTTRYTGVVKGACVVHSREL